MCQRGTEVTKERLSPVGAEVRDGLDGCRVGKIYGDVWDVCLVEVELDLVGCGNQSAEVRIQVSCSDLDAQFSVTWLTSWLSE